MPRYDAGYERERLARELADWKASGFIDSRIAQRWDRRVKRLARVAKRPLAEMREDLERDAEAILAECDEAR
ncbi:MAG: hypothetical protein WD066_02570 [Planctomycetaceae bacterium]